MVKHLRILMFLIMAIAIGGGSYAQEVTLDFTTNDWGLPTTATKTAKSYSNGTYSISFGASSKGHYFASSNKCLIFGQNGATLSLPAFDFDVEKIVVTGNTGASSNVIQNFYVGTTAVSKETTGATSANTYLIDESHQAAGTIYTLKVTSKHNTQVTKIEIFKKGSSVSKTATTVTFGEDNDNKTFSLNIGDEFAAPTATLTPAEAGSLSYTSSNTDVATVDATTGAVTLTGTTGKTTIKAAFAGNDTYAASEASYTLNVAKKLSLTGQGTKESPYTVADVLAIVGEGQQTTDNVYVKCIVSSVDKYWDKYKQLDYYLVDNEGDAEKILAYNGKYLDNTDFTSANQLKAGDKVVVYGVLTKFNETVEIGRGNYIVEFWGEHAEKTATTTTFGEDNDNKTFALNIGDEFTAPKATLTPAEAGSVTYSSDNEAVANVDATTGDVTLGETAGTAKITASFAGNDTYAASSASYTINLTKPFVVEDGVFDFTHPEAYGYDCPQNNKDKTDVAEGNVLNAGKVTLTNFKKGSTATRFYNNNGKVGLRVYKDAQLAISVPADYIVTGIDIDANNTNVYTIGDLNKNVVYIDFSNYSQLQKMTVTYEKAPVAEDVTLTIGSTGYATLYYSDRALIVPENTEVNTYSAEFGQGLKVSHTYDANDVIPAGEAVVVYALEPGDYVFKVGDGTGIKLDDTNMLSGTDEEALIADDANTYKFYKLSLNNAGDANSVGFYWGAANGAAFVNGAHKAYLKVTKDQANGAKAFVFGGNATGIKTIKASEDNADAPLYNLAGQRVGKSYKGIVIRNGKKYVK